MTVGCYFLVFSDLITANKQNADKLKAVQADNDSLRPFQGKLADLDRQIENLKQQLEIQKRIVPDEKQTDEFIHMVEASASAAGIEVRRFTSKTTSSHEFYTEAPYELDIDGPYYSVLNFFDKVSKLERIINISGLQMASGTGTHRGEDQEEVQIRADRNSGSHLCCYKLLHAGCATGCTSSWESNCQASICASKVTGKRL